MDKRQEQLQADRVERHRSPSWQSYPGLFHPDEKKRMDEKAQRVDALLDKWLKR